MADFAALGVINKILGATFGALKMGLILSVILIVFDKFNSTITFTEKKTLQESVLYIPVKAIAPIIFPNILKSDEDTTDIEQTTN